jgi:hypothetical protein
MGRNGRHVSKIGQQIKLRRYPPVDAEEPVVDDRGDWQRVEGENARFVDPGGIFVQALASDGERQRGEGKGEGLGCTFAFEGKILCQMSALVVSSQQGQFVGVPQFERV